MLYYFTALLIIVIWLVTSLVFQFSDTWKLTITIGTTLFMALLVFLLPDLRSEDHAAQINNSEALKEASSDEVGGREVPCGYSLNIR